MVQSFTYGRNRQQFLFNFAFETVITVSAADAVEVSGQRAYRGRDRHLVIVEHDDQAALQVAGLIDGFHRHAERSRERGGSVSGAKSVVFRFVASKKAADAAVLLDCGE